MKAKTLILVVIALGCGLVASIGISQVMGKKAEPKQQSKPIEKVNVLIAATDLDIGATLTEENIIVKSWPKENVPQGALADVSQLEGLLTRVRLSAGMPILSQHLSNKINIPIPEGMRVIPVKINASQVFGGIQPGDHVDVLVFLRLRDDKTKKETSMVRTVLKDVRLFGVNTKIDRVMQDGKQVSVRTVELLLKPAQVNLLTLAEELGTLRLSMRNIDDTSGDEEETLATLQDLLGKPAELATEREPESAEEAKKRDSFHEFLEDMTGEKPAEVAVAAAPAHTMVVHTPSGLVEYRWSDLNGSPEVARVGFGAATIPRSTTAPPHAEPKDEPSGAGDSGQKSKADQTADADEELDQPAD